MIYNIYNKINIHSTNEIFINCEIYFAGKVRLSYDGISFFNIFNAEHFSIPLDNHYLNIGDCYVYSIRFDGFTWCFHKIIYNISSGCKVNNLNPKLYLKPDCFDLYKSSIFAKVEEN